MGLSLPHILIALSAFALLFGTGKISALMGDVAKGIKSFKKGLTEEWEDEAKPEVKVVQTFDLKAPIDGNLMLPEQHAAAKPYVNSEAGAPVVRERAAPRPRRTRCKAGGVSSPKKRTAPKC
jgi:sec-independent protein translocase protein TatA